MQTTAIQGFQLSPQQRRIWSLQQNSSSYLTQGDIYLEGYLQPAILKAAVAQIVARHQILRTTFNRIPGVTMPVMVVSDRHLFSWQELDFSETEQLSDYNRQEYNLEKDPPLHCSLNKLSSDRHILQITLPALCGDRWTIANLFAEIVETYSNLLQDKDSQQEVLPYVQFAEWQNQLLTDEDAEAVKDFWQEQQLTDRASRKLPWESQPALPTEFEVNSLVTEIAPDLTSKIKAIAQKHQTSVEVVLLTCWQIQNWRLADESSIIIGAYGDRREFEEMHPIMGLLASYLPVKADLTADLSFSEVLIQNKQILAEVQEWQDYFVPASGENADNLVFPVGFEFQTLPQKQSVGELSFSLLKQSSCIEKFKLKLSGFYQQLIPSLENGAAKLDRPNSLVTTIDYDPNYFSPEAIASIARQFQVLLTDAVSHPESKITRLAILEPDERESILTGFNQNQQNYPQDKCIHQLFAAQVQKTPNKIAVVFEDRQLTYQQLNRQANKLANLLRKKGVKAEVLVGLYVEKSLEAIIGMLAILKAGGAYLPLDSTLPTEALIYRLKHTQIVLTHKRLFDTLPEPSQQVICLDRNKDEIESENDLDLTTETTSSNLAYVLFTSGSTGEPKGVAIEHQQLLNYIYAVSDRLNLASHNSFATVSSLAADLGSTVIFPALCAGGCLHLISQERATNPEALAEYCDRHPIDCLKIVPSHLNALLSCSSPQKILPRKSLIMGGEVLHWQLIDKIREYQPDCQIYNHYGPTETTVGVCTFAVGDQVSDSESSTVPLGYPLPNNQVYILDKNLQPVPIGIPGELYIGGKQVARSYFNSRGLTAEKFIKNPFARLSLYQTGDKARYLPNGKIEFIGRVNRQVKIRGYRIELGEIESVLQRHPHLREVVTAVREDRTRNKRLIAYIVVSRQQTVTDRDLQDFLQSKLPIYMLPATFVRLKSLPLTANGKVDRLALPEPGSVQSDSDKVFIAPRNTTESILAEIWAKILKIERVSIENNFFEIGGDSILSIQIVAKANQAGLKLTPKQMFEYPTIASLATEVETTSSTQHQGDLLSLTPVQSRYLDWQISQECQSYQTLLVETREKIQRDRLEQAVKYLLEYHDALRLRFTQNKSGWQQFDGGLTSDEVTSWLDLSGLPPTEQDSIFQEEVAKLENSLNLQNDLLIRVALFDLGENRPNKLIVIIHYLIGDLFSGEILLKDLDSAYQQLNQGKAIKLSFKTSFYKWSSFLQEYIQSTQLKQQQEYWITELAQPVLKLPTNIPNEEGNVIRSISVALSKEETSLLQQKALEAYRNQTEEILLAALLQTFNEVQKAQFLMVDLELGKPRGFIDRAFSKAVGQFTNVFPIIFECENVSQLGDLLASVKERLRSVPDLGIGYGVLRYLSKDLSIVESLQSLPQAQIKFSFSSSPNKLSSSLFESKSLLGNYISPRDKPYLININSYLVGERLQIDWQYSANYRADTIEQLSQQFITKLKALILHCQSTQTTNYTPSDFPQANLNQKDLKKFLGKIDQIVN